MVDIIPSSQLVIGNGAFSIVYRARLKLVSVKKLSKLRKVNKQIGQSRRGII